MKLLPYDKFELTVKLPVLEVQKRLMENAPERKFFSGTFDEPKAFKGSIEETTFKIYRNVGSQCYGLPILHGKLEECEIGTRITVTVKLQRFVQLLLLIFLAFEIKLLVEGIKKYSFGFNSILIIAVMFISILVVAVVIFGGFRFEYRLSKSAFLELFKNETIPANKEDTPGPNAAR